MSLDNELLESIRDESFKLAQEEKKMFEARKYFNLCYAIEDYLRHVQIRTRSRIQLSEHEESP